MNKALYEGKLKEIRHLAVPSLFTSRQFDVLVKRIGGKRLSQTEKNYLSNAIKSKLKAVTAVKHLGLDKIYGHGENKKAIFDGIISGYNKSGVDLVGYEASAKRNIHPTNVVEEVLDNYQEIDARIADLLPVYISKNKDSINLFEIYSFAVERGLVNFAGYVFEIAYSFSRHKGFKQLIDSLNRIKDKKALFRDKKYEKITDLIRQDNLSRKWNIYTLNNLDHYKNYFELYGEI